MKNSIFFFSVLFFVLFFGITIVNAQTVGDRSPQSTIFSGHPIWPDLTSEDTYRIMLFKNYFACPPGSKVICWNASTGGMAVVQEFSPEDSVIVLTHKGVEYLYKIGCHNRLEFIRVETPKTTTSKIATPSVTFAKPCNQPNPCDDVTCDELVVATWCLDAGKGCFTDVCGFTHKAKRWKIDFYNNRLPSGWIIDECGRQFFINPQIPACPCDKWQTGKYNY